MKLYGSFAILRKELIHMARDPLTILFAMLPPIAQVIAFGYAINTDVRNLATVIYDQDAREESRSFIHSLVNTGAYRIKNYVRSREELTQTLVEGRAVVGVEIPPDYTDRIKSGKSAQVSVFLDGSNNTIALQALAVANGVGLQSLVNRLTDASGQLQSAIPIEVRPRVLFNPDLLSANFFVPGIIGVAMQFFLTMLVSFAIVREREIGTLEQLMVSPATRFALVLGKVIPYLFFAYIEMGILVLIMTVLFGIDIRGSVLLLFGLSGIFALAAIGFGLFISASAQNQMQATQMAMGILMPSIFFSGFIYPRDTMPAFFYGISFLIPITYFIDILRGIILRGAEFTNLLRSVIPLSIMAVCLFSLSVFKFRKRLD